MMILKVFTSAICAISVVAATAADDKILSDPVYFYKDWCPIEAERIELSKHFNLTMLECCIAKAERLDFNTSSALTALQPYMSHVAPDQDISWCIGDNAEQKLKRKQETQASNLTRSRAATIERADLPSILRRLDMSTLCVETGKLVREESWLVVAPNMQSTALPFVKAEIKRRSISFNENRAKRGQIATGDSECQLYASWGLPVSANRTTGSTSYIQHVYRGSRNYVYTRNGRITAWQD